MSPLRKKETPERKLQRCSRCKVHENVQKGRNLQAYRVRADSLLAEKGRKLSHVEHTHAYTHK